METTIIRPERSRAHRSADELRLEWRTDGSLWAVRGEDERPVSVRRCFPWSEPTRHLSLRDSDEEEFALVTDPAELHPRSRAALEMALAVAGFVFEVTRVLEIEEEVEIRRWRVETRPGPRPPAPSPSAVPTARSWRLSRKPPADSAVCPTRPASSTSCS